jgi:6-phosphogluconate dehydrogenase
LRLAARGLRVSVWDAAVEHVARFEICEHEARDGMVAYEDFEDFVESLNTPRRIVIFEQEADSAALALRSLLRETDRLLEYPHCVGALPFDELALLELTLVFQLG